MKNGRALAGHRRIVQRPPTGGWDASCICGWAGGNWPTSEKARRAYRTHLDEQIDKGLFRCKRCGRNKSLDQMCPDYRYLCRACRSKLGNEWQEQHPRQSAKHKRDHHLRKKFGITVEESERLLAQQGGVCAICRQPISDVRGYAPHVDHDHATQRIRGILCIRCNNGLGLFKSDPHRLRAAADYLERKS